jgi:hypothetical protein
MEPTLPESDARAERRERFLALTDALREEVWRADSLGRSRTDVISTGYPTLNAELPGGGWSASALTELLWAQQGAGEFRILIPALKTVSDASRTIVLLGSPHCLIAPALEQAGIDIGQILIVNAEKPADRLWSAEQILKSGSVGVLVSWHPAVKAEHLRRLQIAASGCEALSFILRPATCRGEPSPAPLRLLCEPAPFGQLSVDVFKRRGPTVAQPVLLPPLFAPSMMRALERARHSSTVPAENSNVDRLVPQPVTARSRLSTVA